MDDDELIIFDDDDDDKLIFSDDPDVPVQESGEPWLIAIVDDEEQIHEVTKLALGHFRYNGQPLKFLSAYSAKEGIELFRQHHNIAICLLDVVMETEQAGLDMVKDIRAMNNHFTRIVLRTGQPGQAPEEKVITEYDINDYKEKTELTRPKLITLMHSCLKTYEYIVNQEQVRIGLEHVIDATSKVFNKNFIDEFVSGILTQMSSLFNFGQDSAMIKVPDGFAGHEENNQLKIISGLGEYEHLENQSLEKIIPEKLYEQLVHQVQKFQVIHNDRCFIASYISQHNARYFLLLSGDIGNYTSLQYRLVTVFCHNVLMAFENLYLKSEVEDTQWEMVFMLGEAVETRSKETGYHLKRVAELSHMLANTIGLDEHTAELIRQASPLHDIGKIAIPDAVLNKPGKLNEEEWEIMQTHVTAGYNMLRKSKKEVMQTASFIARDHHERWDGAGYPDGLSTTDISIEGRITAVADVFDALASKRCYKEAWNMTEVFDYMQESSGTQFDPKLIEALMKIKDDVLSLYEQYQ